MVEEINEDGLVSLEELLMDSNTDQKSDEIETLHLQKASASYLLSDKMKVALTRYYTNQQNQGTVPWDKGADLDVVYAAASEAGWGWERLAGTYWFSKQIEGTDEYVSYKMSNLEEVQKPITGIGKIVNES